MITQLWHSFQSVTEIVCGDPYIVSCTSCFLSTADASCHAAGGDGLLNWRAQLGNFCGQLSLMGRCDAHFMSAAGIAAGPASAVSRFWLDPSTAVGSKRAVVLFQNPASARRASPQHQDALPWHVLTCGSNAWCSYSDGVTATAAAGHSHAELNG